MWLSLVLYIHFTKSPAAKLSKNRVDDGTDETIGEFEDEYGTVFTSPEVEAEHEEQLKKDEEEIKEHNEEYDNGDSAFFEEVNELSDLSPEEMKEYKEGKVLLSVGFFIVNSIALCKTMARTAPVTGDAAAPAAAAATGPVPAGPEPG